MDEISKPAPQNRITLLLLGVIVVLLVVVAVIIATGGKDTSPTGTDGSGSNTNTTGTVSPATPFDPATATKVPAGETPEQYVTRYFDAIVAGDFATAYALLPTDKKATQDEASFAQQLAGYGIGTYTIDSATEADDQAEVLATATASGGAFQYLWTFVKGSDGGWLVKSRTLPGMGQ